MLLDEVTNSESRRYTVAVVGRRIVGYCGAMFVIDEMHLNTIGVRTEWEGRGVAASMLDELWPAAIARGATKATLEVAVSNTRAQALYRRYGFAPVGVRKNYYPKVGEDALVLWADLVPLQESSEN
jgi:ribosomal-protein-alanine N-acetyltransferase